MKKRTFRDVFCTEALICRKRKTTWIAFVLLVLLCCYESFVASKSMAGYMIETGNSSVFESDFSPVLNAILLMTAMLGETIYMIVGFVEGHGERKEGCLNQRLLFCSESRLAAVKFFVAAINIGFVCLITSLIGAVGQFLFNAWYGKYKYIFAWNDIAYFLSKFFTVLCLLLFYYLLGMIVSRFVENMVMGILLLLILDQVLLSQTYLHRMLLMSEFTDSRFLVTITGENIIQGTQTLRIFLLTMSVLAIGAAYRFALKRKAG